MKKKKIIIPIIITLLLAITLGTTYAFFKYLRVGDEKNVLVTGDIYMHYTESAGFLFENALPISKEKGLEQTNNIFNFTIIGKNTSSKDIYYGVSIVIDETPEGKTPIDPSNVVFYLTSGEDILIDAIRYNNFDNPIYVATIPKNTNSETRKDYTLRAWLTEDIWISDTDEGADYTMSDWNNSYLSFKVKVEGTMDKMNMPLTIEHDDTSIQNNKQFFIARVSNYLNPEEAGELLETNDEMKLEITSDSNNIEFTYKDSTGEEKSETSESLTLNYTFNKKQSEEVQVFVTPKNDTNTDVDVNIKLTKNSESVYDQVINMNIKGNNYCLNNGFDKLGDCILVSENQSESVESAKTYINSKTYNLNDTAPTYTYVEDISYDVSNPSYAVVSGYKFNFGDGIEFNTTTGTYKLTGNIITDNLSSAYVGKYTCGTMNFGISSCSSVVKILAVDDSTSKITKADTYTYKIANTLRSEVGLYKTTDDYGDTYFFRGDVENNNVYFGEYYWKIVRMNGDNSIRLVYNGETKDATGYQTSINNTEYTYAPIVSYSNDLVPRHSDPTYVGYMYGAVFSTEDIVSAETTYNDIAPDTKYYFASSYNYDENTQTYKLLGNDIQYKTYEEMYAEGLFDTYPYSCKFALGIKEDCHAIVKVKTYFNNTSILAEYISRSSISNDTTRLNTNDSNVKSVIDKWYQINIIGEDSLRKVDEVGNYLSDYIVDSTFCNDRSMVSGDGYSLVPSTIYSAYNRLVANDVFVSLSCGDSRDKFSTTATYGNAKLTNPIALLTVDEIVLSGGKLGLNNSDYYLNSGSSYWTMTPSFFTENQGISRVFTVSNVGSIYDLMYVHGTHAVRPVINLSPDVLISEGDGTIDNPFKLKLA